MRADHTLCFPHSRRSLILAIQAAAGSFRRIHTRSLAHGLTSSMGVPPQRDVLVKHVTVQNRTVRSARTWFERLFFFPSSRRSRFVYLRLHSPRDMRVDHRFQ